MASRWLTLLNQESRLRIWGGLIFVAAAWSAVVLGSLTSYPLAHIDEVMFASVAKQVVSHGSFGLPIHPDVFGSAENFRSAGRLYIGGLAAVFGLLGTGLFQARLYAWLGGLLGGFLVFGLGQRLYGRLAGLLSAALYLFSWRIFLISHSMRPEIWIVSYAVLCLSVLLHLREKQSGWAWAGLGFLAASILNIYVPGYHFILLVSFWAITWNIRPARWPNLLGFALGGVFGGGLFALLHLFPNPAQAVEQLTRGHTGYYFRGGAWSLIPQLDQFMRLVEQSFLGFSRLSPIEALTLLAGLIGLAARRHWADRFVLGTLALGVLSLALLQSQKAPRYMTFLSPMLSLAGGAGTLALLKRLGLRGTVLRRGAQLLPAVLLLTAYALGDFVLAWRARAISYEGYAQQLKVLVPGGAGLFADGIWWFTFFDQPFTADDYLIVSHDWLQGDPQQNLADLFQARRVAFVLLDEQLASYWSATQPNPDPEYPVLAQFVSARCQEVGQVSGPLYGVESGGPAVRVTRVFDCSMIASSVSAPGKAE